MIKAWLKERLKNKTKGRQRMNLREESMTKRDTHDRLVHEIAGQKIHRRDIMKAGLTGATLATVAGVVIDSTGAEPGFPFPDAVVPRTRHH